MQRRKQWLTRGGLYREDSDDELGDDDLPWQWVYDKAENEETIVDNLTTSKKRKASTLQDVSKSRSIVGAKTGPFLVKIGDTVLLKSPEEGKDWAGLICGFSKVNEDDEEEMCAHIQWFCSPEELSTGKRSKTVPETLPNESYITSDFNLNPLTAINGKAIVLSKNQFLKKYPKGVPPKTKAAAQWFWKTILCRKGVKQRTLQFTEEFIWEERYRGPESLLELIDWIKEQTKGRRKQTGKDDPDLKPQTVQKQEDIENEATPTTPRKRQKTTPAATTPKSTSKSTPKSTVKSNRFITPTHKRIMIKKPIEITPLGTRIISPSQYISTPYSHARTNLHVSSVPTFLPCRNEEFAKVFSHLRSAIDDGTGACIYISGTPGTGKTATVREVVMALHQAVLNDELDDFNFVEINGMKVTEPTQSYSLLWEALKGDRVSPNNALELLEHEFSHPSPRRIPCVVLMDELDQLVTKNQSVMYNFFNWPALRHSRLIVLAVANTMDLPERTLSNKINSRLGLTRITFPGYTHVQLMEIITSRLENVPGNIVDSDAIQFASRKVAAVSGDARRALDICRRAVELAQLEDQKENQNEINDEKNLENTPTKTNRYSFGNPLSLSQSQSKSESTTTSRVSIKTIKQAIYESTSSPLTTHLKSMSLANKIFLGALLTRFRRTGIAESNFGDVLLEARRLAESSEMLYNNNNAITANDMLPKMASLVASAAVELVEAGILNMEGGRNRGERAAKVRLRVAEEEVRSAFLGDFEVRGLGLVEA